MRLRTWVLPPRARALWPLGVAVVVAMGAVVTWPPAVEAAALGARGWWSQFSVSAPGGAGRPDVKPGELVVEAAASEAVSVAAVRFSLDEGESAPVLALEVTGVTGTPVVLACAAASNWLPADGGAWADRPKADCATSVEGTLHDDGSAYSFSVAPLAVGRTVDVVLLPAKVPNDEEAPSSPTFRLVLASPTLTTTTARVEQRPTPAPLGPVGSAASGHTDPHAGRMPISFGADASLDDQGAEVVSTGAAAADECCESRVAAAPLADESRGRPRLLGALVLLAAVVLALVGLPWIHTAAHADRGGLGRFARERVGEPPRLV